MAIYNAALGRFFPELPQADCEYTAPGSTTEAIDCWERAEYRVVAADDGGLEHPIGVFCEKHVPTPAMLRRLRNAHSRRIARPMGSTRVEPMDR